MARATRLKSGPGGGMPGAFRGYMPRRLMARLSSRSCLASCSRARLRIFRAGRCSMGSSLLRLFDKEDRVAHRVDHLVADLADGLVLPHQPPRPLRRGGLDAVDGVVDAVLADLHQVHG